MPVWLATVLGAAALVGVAALGLFHTPAGLNVPPNAVAAVAGTMSAHAGLDHVEAHIPSLAADADSCATCVDPHDGVTMACAAMLLAIALLGLLAARRRDWLRYVVRRMPARAPRAPWVCCAAPDLTTLCISRT